ncbi:MAG: hypothetical protein FWG57_05565 [Endomicrobia bacterium]|nr:hypothetical protein [Endomicrobiia bacterium]
MKHIFFDIGNVLIKFKLMSFLKAFNNSELDESFLNCLDMAFLGEAPEDNIIMSMNKLAGKDIFAFYEETKFKNSWIQINNELFEIIRNYSDKFKYGIISDLWCVPYKIITAEYPSFFSHFPQNNIFISYKTGFSKREHGAQVFENVLNTLDIAPGNILYIDDDFENVKNAQLVNMNAICYNIDDKASNKQLLQKIAFFYNS